MPIEFNRVNVPGHERRLINFLCDHEWPFHSRTRLTAVDVMQLDFASSDVTSFCIVDQHQLCGLIRLFDLDDIGQGAPLFDLRIAESHRGQGYGKHATRWLTNYLFGNYPELHRIEANTRADNEAMQHVLVHSGYMREGTLRQSWAVDDGSWRDTMVFGILRTDWTVSGAPDVQ